MHDESFDPRVVSAGVADMNDMAHGAFQLFPRRGFGTELVAMDELLGVVGIHRCTPKPEALVSQHPV